MYGLQSAFRFYTLDFILCESGEHYIVVHLEDVCLDFAAHLLKIPGSFGNANVHLSKQTSGFSYYK